MIRREMNENDPPSKQRVIIVHGSAMTPGIVHRHWYKWLEKELNQLGFQAIAPAFPDEQQARDSIWIPYLINDLHVQQDDILIGHSSGAMAILRLCEQRPVKGLILVSAGYDQQSTKDRWNWNQIRSNTQWIEQFHSSDDPFTSVESSRQIAQQLRSTYYEFHDRNHFLCPEFPDLIERIQSRCHPVNNVE